MGITTLKNNLKLARIQWDRYTSNMERGHLDYQTQAQLCEDFYLGAGRQWQEDAKKILEDLGKPWLEENIIFSTINTVIGYQTQSRMDIAYKPREDGDQTVANILTKIGMFEVDRNKYPWLESQVFGDGLIQQRGFFDVRLDFSESLTGDIKIVTLDPLDVIPDPDAKSYDPSDWSDVTVTKWMTFDDIKIIYGTRKWRAVTQMIDDEPDFGEDGFGVERNKFGTVNTYQAYFVDGTGTEHARVIERQWYKLQNREFFADNETGDLEPVPDELTVRQKNQLAKSKNATIIKKLVKRIRWTVSTRDVVLYDEWSPYDSYTIIPYFPYFRRGVTVGLVDNLIKTQEMLNKVYSQILHIVNTTANSGWKVEENSLVNMDVEELEDIGAQTGLILEYKTGRPPPEKIEPNPIPTGLKDLINTGLDLIRIISGVSETFQGGKGPEVSGSAIQSRVYQAAVQLAAPLDNLFRSRNLMASKLLELIQQFYTEERTFLIISGTSDEQEKVIINQQAETGFILNDVTTGKYDAVISDVPTQVTFQNSQFAQAVELRKYGVAIPDDEMVLMSSLARKQEIAEKMSGQSPQQQEAQQRQMMLQEKQLEAETEKSEAAAKKSYLDALEKATNIAVQLNADPTIARILDSLMDKAEQLENDEDMEQEGQPQMQPQQIGGGMNYG